MAEKSWYIFSQGVTFGPLPTKVVRIMIEQKRVMPTEFAWSAGMSRWERIRDRVEFGGEALPPYPEIPLPDDDAPEVEEDEEPEPVAVKYAAAPAPAPVAAAPASAKAHKPAAKPAVKSAPARTATAAAAKAEPHVHAPAKESAPQPQLKMVPPVAAPAQAHAAPAPSAEARHLDPSIRRSPRVYLKGTVVVEGQGKFDISDISDTGLLLKSPKSMAPGTHLDFMIESDELEKSPLQMTGIVARTLFSQGKDCIAIEFVRVNPAHRRILKNLVAEKTEKGEVVK